MTVANIRVNANVPFPALVNGSGPITIAKSLGIWNIGFSLNQIVKVTPQAAAYPTDYILFYDSVAQNYFKMSISDIVSAVVSSAPNFDIVAGNYAVTTESVLLIKKTVPAAHNITLPGAATRSGASIVIKDVAGNAAANVATIVPNGAETIDGLASLPINSNYGGFKLVPISTGGWYISP